MRYCLYIEDSIDSLVEQQRNNPTPQAIDRGQCKPLEEIFIVVVHLISSFWAALQQGWVDLWFLLSMWRGNITIYMQALNKLKFDSRKHLHIRFINFTNLVIMWVDYRNPTQKLVH
jgi:hypothetical protein